MGVRAAILVDSILLCREPADTLPLDRMFVLEASTMLGPACKVADDIDTVAPISHQTGACFLMDLEGSLQRYL